jgi:hypothetical protein
MKGCEFTAPAANEIRVLWPVPVTVPDAFARECGAGKR